MYATTSMYVTSVYATSTYATILVCMLLLVFIEGSFNTFSSKSMMGGTYVKKIYVYRTFLIKQVRSNT